MDKQSETLDPFYAKLNTVGYSSGGLQKKLLQRKAELKRVLKRKEKIENQINKLCRKRRVANGEIKLLMGDIKTLEEAISDAEDSD